MLMNPPFHPLLRGDRIGLIGDSITCDSRWWAHLRTGLLTAHPACELEFINLAIPGDNAAEALERYEWDIAPAAITAAIVMLGMNDVWRAGYETASPTQEIEEKRRSAIQAYGHNLTNLLDRLLTDRIRIVLLSPSPYEQEASLPELNLHGVDDALAECTRIARTIAAARDVKFVDLHAPMRMLGRELRKADPCATIVGADRVHPEDKGHAVLGRLVLEALDPSERVSVVATAALSSMARTTEGKKRGEWIWEYTGGLPDPTPQPLELRILKLPPREIVLRAAVKPGEWILSVDQAPVLHTNAGDLAAGVELSCLNSPLLTTARAIQDAGEAVVREEKRMRNLLMLQIWSVRNGFTREGEGFLKYLEQLTNPEPPDHWLHISAGDARQLLRAIPEHKERMNDLRNSLKNAAQPWRHRIELKLKLK